jgi:hypothetical protein
LQKKFTTNQLIITAFLFVVFYGVMLIWSGVSSKIELLVSGIPALNVLLYLPEFESPMFWLMPVVGFFTMFLLVDWVNGYFETSKALSIWLPLLFFILGLAAFSVALYWENANYAAMQSDTQQIVLPYLCYAKPDFLCPAPACDCAEIVKNINKSSSAKIDSKQLVYFNVPFWERLRISAFYLFLISGIFGWLSRYAVEKLKL